MSKLGTFTASQVLTAAELNAGAAAWASWTPTYSNLTIGNGTVTVGYGYTGRIVHFRWNLVFGTTSVMGTTPSITLPVGVAAEAVTARCWFFDASAATSYPGANTSNTAFLPAAFTSSGTYVTLVNLTSAIPFTWTTSDQITISGTYEATS